MGRKVPTSSTSSSRKHTYAPSQRGAVSASLRHFRYKVTPNDWPRTAIRVRCWLDKEAVPGNKQTRMRRSPGPARP